MNIDDIRIYTEGDKLYEAMLNSIAVAKEHIMLESYIFSADAIGWKFAKAFAEQARRGIKVRLLIDSVGSFFHLSRTMRKFLRINGVDVRFFHHWSWRQPFRYNNRNHRKLLIIDRHTVFLGGFNIHQESSFEWYGSQHWRDTHIAFSGTIVDQLIDSFEKFWKSHLVPIKFEKRVLMPKSLTVGSSRLYERHLRLLFKNLWPLANNSIYLTTPYFVPDLLTQRGLIEAAERGVDVRILVPRKSDIRLTRWAARAAYANLLHAGVRIFEYLPRMLHAKTVIIDDEWASIGTANMDYRSFFANYEINLLSRGTPLCVELKNQFLDDLHHAEEICKVKWPNRPWSEHITEAIGWIARRWL